MLRVRFFRPILYGGTLPRRSIRLITRLLRSPGALFSSDTPPCRNIFSPQFILSFRHASLPAIPTTSCLGFPHCPYVVFRVSVPFLFRFGPYPPASVRFYPSPPEPLLPRPRPGPCCCRSGAAVALPLPRLATIRVPFSSGVAAFPGPAVPRSPVSPLCSLYSLYHSDAA